MSYENTKVPVAKSQQKLRDLLLRNKGGRVAFISDPPAEGFQLVADGASLDGASLDGASLDFIKHDLWGLLLHVPNEIDGLTLALREGRVDGSVYEGDCACLVGTIANVKHCNYQHIPGVKPDSSRPAEVWFMGIAKGDTAEKNQIVKITLDWIEEFKQLTAAK